MDAKTYLITGGSSGIGLSIAEKLISGNNRII
jgi:short-subunit dehydrogenase involved in D-alanine esterification of teichoic acids